MEKEDDLRRREGGSPPIKVRWECNLCHEVYSFQIQAPPALKPSVIDPEECYKLAKNLAHYIHLQRCHVN